MGRTLSTVVLFTVVAAACTTTTEQTMTLAEELESVSLEADQAVADLFATLDQPFDDRSQLYTRLIDLRLPGSLAILVDKANRVVAPPGAEAELARYTSYLGELLEAAEDLDGAIAAEDPTATAIAAVEFEVSAGALAVALPASSCAALVPDLTADLCDPGGLEGYEASLAFELRKFVASFRPAFRVPDTFGDVVRGRVLATLQDDATLVLQNTATRIAALDPGTVYVRVHEVLLDYFPLAAAAWAEFDVRPDSADAFIYEFIVDRLEAERINTEGQLETELPLVEAALPASRIREVTDMWFNPLPPSE